LISKGDKTKDKIMAEDKKKYSAEEIKILEGLEGVRKRPAMYIGSTGKEGLHHLVYEVVDNSVDEAMAGYCTKVTVIIRKDGAVSVEDNGRGIPVEMHPVYKKPALEIVITKLHAGGKFEHKAYAVSGGLHGVGLSVVAALSKKLIAEIERDGKVWQQEYEIGNPVTKIKAIGNTETTGTKITFWPDTKIFSTTEFDFLTISTRLREIAFLNPGLSIELIDEKKDKKETFSYTGGLIEFVKWLNRTKEALHKPVYFKKTADHTIVDVAIQYNNSYQENIYGFVNTINTVEGGTHIVGFKTALTRVINDYAKKQGILKEKDEPLTGDDTREGLTAIVSIRIPEPQFEGQTKTKLGNSEVKGYVDSVVTSSLAEFFEENPPIARRIVQKITEAAKARLAAKKAKELVRRKSAFGVGGLPGKLADCSSNKTEDTELFIVEGESAGGSAKQARNKEYQAILPLKGKIMNVEKANPTKVLSSEEISNLITAIGTGVTESFDIEKLRYGRIVIMTDADVDGQHIKTLLLTFFYRYMPKLIENGNVYVAVSPLYRVRKKEDFYVYSDEELKIILKKVGENSDVQRFKGLGEMNPQQLWDTTMNPRTRIMKRVAIEDAVEADTIFSILMGEEVAPRKKFIIEHAHEAFLDI
jgi:DNA gyrase subunit B